MINNLIGAGAPSSIKFINFSTGKTLNSITNSNKDDLIRDIKARPGDFGIEITVTSTNQRLIFNINRILGEGGYGIVFELKSDEIPEIMVLKISSKDNDISSEKEGVLTEKLNILEICKALYQGAKDVDFVIYRYLGSEISSYVRTINRAEDVLTMFRQLYDQIYKLNIINQFHNDVKKENTVIADVKHHLYLIDYGIADTKSTMGTYTTICMYGCLDELSQVDYKGFIDSIGININELKKHSKSTDIIGFFNFIIDVLLLGKGKNIYSNIFLPFLELERGYTTTNLIKMLCLFCILSYNREPYNILSKNAFCKPIIDEIEKKLYDNSRKAEIIFDIKITRDYFGLTSLYTYLICKERGNFDKNMYLFIKNLVINCYNSNFDLKYFDDNYYRMFNIKFLIPYPLQRRSDWRL
jgi:serine/threonine protein kinase